MEWQLLFHYVLHFPTLVEETVKVKTETGGGAEEARVGDEGGGLAGKNGANPPLVPMEVSVNKVC